jgi:hypothetical protein|tara:strand:- start:400 stop:594 length:195 start_codon:yes stop_codon:yes gene_type:complete
MAHLITLTGAVDGQEMLFNLDTVVSIENGNNSTIINTRWGNTLVKESLGDIRLMASVPKKKTKN